MNLLLLGLSHQTAPVAVRERYSVTPAECLGVNEKLVQEATISEAAVLSTCNRTELLALSSSPDDALECLYRVFHDEIGDGSAEAEQFYQFRGADVVTHLFRVSSSLDSMVLGEAQILGQVKEAYRTAIAAAACGPILHRLFERSFRTAKRVRTETGLGASLISVARVGVQLAEEIFEAFEGKSILLIGAGEMAESALYGFRDAGVSDIVVLNRTLETAEQLARGLSGRAAPLSDLPGELARADAVVTSVAVARPLLGAEEIQLATRDRQGRPLLLIDLGVPRNVDQSVNDLQGVYLYDLDDLDGIAERGRESRRDAAAEAEKIISTERERFESWHASLEAAPTIRELIEHASRVGRQEAERSAARIGAMPPELREALNRMADSIVAKLIHRPVESLRAEAEEKLGPYYSDAVREIFGLSEDSE
jgi:glutamyl-tRNA reductase